MPIFAPVERPWETEATFDSTAAFVLVGLELADEADVAIVLDWLCAEAVAASMPRIARDRAAMMMLARLRFYW